MRPGRNRYASRETNCLYLRPENYEGPAVLTTDRKSCIDAAFPIDPRPERGLSGTCILLLDSATHFLYSFVIGRHCPLAARLFTILPLRSGTMITGSDPGGQQIPTRSQAFTTEWGHTGTLLLALPDRKFIVALDPTLFLVKDPALYRLWYEIPRFPRPGMAEVIRNRFGARFVISFLDERFPPFYFQLASEPGVRALLLSDEYGVVFDLGGAPP